MRQQERMDGEGGTHGPNDVHSIFGPSKVFSLFLSYSITLTTGFTGFPTCHVTGNGNERGQTRSQQGDGRGYDTVQGDEIMQGTDGEGKDEAAREPGGGEGGP
jgi:hypothetical protein